MTALKTRTPRILAPLLAALALFAASAPARADARVMNAGEAYGQLVYLSEQDVIGNSPKFKALSPLSIPVFAELPMELSVVAGAITLKQQNLLSHVQIKSRARKTPNLDISGLAGGLESPLMKPYKDGDWVHLLLEESGCIVLEPSTEQAAIQAYEAKKGGDIQLRYDLTATQLFRHSELSWRDFDKVGSKAANYAELARLLNSPERTVVRTGYALPFYYFQEFVNSNAALKAAIDKALRDPLMKKVSRVSYREEKLKGIQDMILSEKQTVISQDLVNKLIDTFEGELDVQGQKRKMKLRSSTNSEDLPNFNGAGLYNSESYKPFKKKVEKDRAKKEESLREALRIVWASVWNLRAFDERAYFRIPHGDVKMGVQINPSFGDEGVDGVVVTKNVANRPNLPGDAVYVEAQRGDKYSVANPEKGTRPEQILVRIDRRDPLNQAAYEIHVLQKSNIADDKETVLDHDNPNPIMSDAEIKDLVFQSLKAEAHFKSLFGRDNPDFALDLEFKVDAEDTGARQVYLKQARPYID